MRGNSAFQLFNREFIAFQEVKKISLFLADLLGPFPDIPQQFRWGRRPGRSRRRAKGYPGESLSRSHNRLKHGSRILPDVPTTSSERAQND